MNHLSLGRPMEASMGPKYICRVCGEKLYTRRAANTNWQEWWYTKDNRRHFKNRCNLAHNQSPDSDTKSSDDCNKE